MVEVLEIFAEAQGLTERRIATEEGGLEALRRAYRERHKATGRCVSCTLPSQPGSRYCPTHKRERNAAALRWFAENRDEVNSAKRERRARQAAERRRRTA